MVGQHVCERLCVSLGRLGNLEHGETFRMVRKNDPRRMSEGARTLAFLGPARIHRLKEAPVPIITGENAMG